MTSGRFLAVKHFGWFALEAYTEIWDVDEGTSIKLTRCGGASGALHFLDEGTLLCAGKDPFGEGSGVGLWDVRTGEEIQPLDAHDGEVFSASASAGGHLIATAGNDGTIVLWDGETFERISTLTYSDGEVFDLELSPDGRRMATTSWAGPIRVWALEAGELLALADTRITRQFTPFECETYDIRSAPCSDVGE